MSSVCSAVQTIKSGNGSQTQFSFDFPYVFKSEIHVYFWNVTTKEYDEVLTTDATYPWEIPTANPTVVNFTGTAPPSPSDSTANIKIRRITNIDDIQALFNPGSAIRSDDLNSNFEQLRFAIQESLCPDITEAEVTTYLQNYYWNNFDETITSTDTWSSSDTKIATTAAINDQIDNAITNDILIDSTGLTKSSSGGQTTLGIGAGSVDLDRIKDADIITSSETNPNNDTTIATTAKIDDMIDDAVTNDILIESNGLTKSTSGGQTTLGIGAGAVDLDRIKSDDIVATSAYSSTWTNEDDKIATAGALAARHDVVVNSDVNPPSTAQVGKQWLSTAAGNQVHKIYDGSGWRTVAVGQPFSPATTTTVRYVDSINGSDASDVTGFLPQAPLQSIGRALDLINASSSGDGSLIKVAPGVYQETLPLRIKKNNVSIVGESMRSCFVHPTVATENNDMFEVDSGSYIANLTLLGLKVPTANQSTRNNSLDNDSTYGLPSNQPFSVRFRTDVAPTILKSPYIQNCTHFSDAHFDNANFDPNTFPSTDAQTYSAVAGDETSAPCGGGLLIDGSAVSSSSPVRSMVVDAFTQICLDGPGVLVTNNGYAQLVSFFGTFTHYHAKAKNGGTINLSNCVSDFGRYGLIADGKSPNPIATSSITSPSVGAGNGATTVTIGAITTSASYHGDVSLPSDYMMITIDGVDYGITGSTVNGSGFDVTLSSPLTSNITSASVDLALRSYISTGGHTFEFVGVGTDYGDHPDNGGVPVEANQVIELNGGKVWQSSTDHVGKFKAGSVLVVDQVAETVDLKDTTVTGNITVTGTVDGRDVATDGTKLDGIESGATADQTASEIKTAYESNSDTNAFTDAEKTKLSGIEANADVVDATSVDAAGAVMNSDTSTTAMQFVVDEDNMSSNSSTKVPTQQSVKAYVDAEVAGVVDSAPGTLDTLNELAAALGDDANFSTTVTNSIATKLPLAGGTMTGNIVMSGSQTVDGRDLSVDGAKLDGIAAGAEVNVNADWNATSGDAQILNKPTIPAAYTDSDVDTHLNTSTANSNEVLSWTGTDYDWVAQSGGSGGGATEINDLSDGKTASSGTSVALGSLAAPSMTGTNNAGLGYKALNTVTSGAHNVAVGADAMNACGTNVLASVAVGAQALKSVTGNFNVGVGYEAGEVITSGADNVCIGKRSGLLLTTGSNNVFVGPDAGDTTTGNNNICIGDGADPVNATVSNTITLGNTSISSFRIPGIQSGATNGQVLTYNSTNGDLELADVGDAATLDGIDSTSFLRSDAADTKTSGDLNFSDNVSATFGNSSDLDVYHNGSQSYIDNNTGALDIRQFASDRSVTIKADNGSGAPVNYIVASGLNGEVQLYHYGTEKFTTKSYGTLTTGSYTGNITAVSALSIDCSTANYFTKTISANSTFTFSNVPTSVAYSFTLELTHTSGTVTWPSAVKWSGDTAPSLTTGKTHLFMFVTDNGGSRWRGAYLVDYTN